MAVSTKTSSSYLLFVGSRRMLWRSYTTMPDVVNERVERMFGEQEFRDLTDIENFGKRRLSKYDQCKEEYDLMVKEQKQGYQTLQDFIHMYAFIIDEALSNLGISLDVHYRINMNGAPATAHDTLHGCTKYRRLTINYDASIVLDIYVENIKTLKQLMDVVLHDVAHGVVEATPNITVSKLPEAIGLFNREHDITWQSAAVMLLNAMYVARVPEEWSQLTKNLGFDLREVIDVTGKVGILNRKKNILPKQKYKLNINIKFRYRFNHLSTIRFFNYA